MGKCFDRSTIPGCSGPRRPLGRKPSWSRSRTYAHLIVLCSLYLWSCGGLSAPGTPGTPKSIEELGTASAEPRLQIVITYNGPLSTHAAVRLEDPRRGTLFWDPGGLYGQTGSTAQDSFPAGVVHRHRDVIWEHAPNLPAYWKFAEGTGDTAMEILEWNLSNTRVERLFAILVAGAQPGGSNGFATETSEPFCAIAVSDFLRRYGHGIVEVSDRYFSPAGLAERLRTQKPDRILVLSTGETPVEYRTASQWAHRKDHPR